MILIATPRDAEEIAAIYLGSRRRHVAFAPLIRSDPEILRWVREVLIPENRVFMLEDSNRIVGMMTVSEAEGARWIDQLYVHPDLTGRGFGTALIKVAKQHLITPIKLFTFQENHGSRRFFERHEFVATRFSDGRHNEERCPDVLYCWDPPIVECDPMESGR